MKKNFFQILLGSLVLALGLSSCKKDDCCATITYDGETDTICVGDDGLTQEQFNAYVALYKSMGASVSTKKKCN